MTNAEIQVIREATAAMYRGKITAEAATKMIAKNVSKESLAEYVIDNFNRGWVSRANLGIDEEGKLI